MKRIVRHMAIETHSVPAKAADQLDEVLHNVLQRLRDGKPARLPGFGRFLPGPEVKFELEQRNDTTKKTNRERQAAGRVDGRRSGR
jgi:nucleoid DNA-binding protein